MSKQLRISELISILEHAMKTHGDIPVAIEGGGYSDATYQVVRHQISVEPGRQGVELRFLIGHRDPEDAALS